MLTQLTKKHKNSQELMFKHKHPYQPFIPENTTKLIVGTLPPPRFSTGDLKPGDVDFCYGSRDGMLWKILDAIFKLDLIYENTKTAIRQRQQFLRENNIGICDIVDSAYRKRINASDAEMQDVVLRDVIEQLKNHPKIKTILFTGGNSKNGPEYHFRKLLQKENISLELVSETIPRIHQFSLEGGRTVKTVSLTAPSGSANRAVGSMVLYKQIKQSNPNFNTLDFRIMQYKPFFMED